MTEKQPNALSWVPGFLRRAAKAREKLAARLLADSTQNRPQAQAQQAAANALTECAEAIEAEMEVLGIAATGVGSEVTP